MWDVRQCWHNYPFQVNIIRIFLDSQRKDASVQHLSVSFYKRCLCSTFSPPKPVSSEQYNYYIAELAFYSSLMFSQFIDVKRKVSNCRFSRHCAATFLLTTFTMSEHSFSISNVQKRSPKLRFSSHLPPSVVDVFRMTTLHCVMF